MLSAGRRLVYRRWAGGRGRGPACANVALVFGQNLVSCRLLVSYGLPGICVSCAVVLCRAPLLFSLFLLSFELRHVVVFSLSISWFSLSALCALPTLGIMGFNASHCITGVSLGAMSPSHPVPSIVCVRGMRDHRWRKRGCHPQACVARHSAASCACRQHLLLTAVPRVPPRAPTRWSRALASARTSDEHVWSSRPCLPRVRGGWGGRIVGAPHSLHGSCGRCGFGHSRGRQQGIVRADLPSGGWRRGQLAQVPTPRLRLGPGHLLAKRS